MRILFLRGVIPACSIFLALNWSIQSIHAQSGQTQVQNSSQSADASVQTPVAPVFNPFPTTPPSDPLLTPIHPATTLVVEPHPWKLAETPSFAPPEIDNPKAPRAFRATAYSLKGRTASGIETGPGVVAADPKVLPLGSLVEIKAGSYSGVYTVHDTGSAVKGNLVDVWMPSSKEARQFGRRAIKLQVLRYGPATSQKKSK